MFDPQPASPSLDPSRTRTVLVALLVHACLIVVAVRGTTPRAPQVPALSRDTIRIDIGQVYASTGSDHPRPRFESNIPPPPAVPPIDFDADARAALLREFIPPGTAEPRRMLTLPRAGAPHLPSDTIPPVWNTIEVDELPGLREGLRLRYPEGLRRAGVSGSVLLQYVVQSNGRMDAGSVRVRSSTHPGFVVAAMEALRRARFSPARRKGQPVAVLVQQTIRFRSE